MSPASGSTFTATIRPPLRFVSSRAPSMRGWFVPGFWPITMTRSALAKSSYATVDLPMPMVALSAVPVDSWHMFEQSGRLLVPNARTNSW